MRLYVRLWYDGCLMMTTIKPVGDLLREWRQRRRMSQIDLACSADISAAYLSCLETGRSPPTRDVVLRIAERLEIPLRERNLLLTAAGFAPSFQERPLADPALVAARAGIDAVLAAYEPYPALAVDRHWGVIAANPSFWRMVAGADPMLMRKPVNLLRLCLHPAGLAPRITNPQQWRSHVIGRLRRQIEVSGDPELSDLLEEILDYPAPPAETGRQDYPADNGVAVPFCVASIDGTLAFLNTTTVFGSAVDITLAELRIEAMLPADAQTAEVMHRLAVETARAPRPALLTTAD
jgi:transcriptional regulator with XRE-family HTH domain